jgi:PAT family beta-lactamase induction signal transducer AmpG
VESFAELFRDLKQLLTRREVWWMMALFLAPTGSFALTNQLGGVARDFHASDAFVSRMGGAVLSFAGATVCLLLPVFARWIKPLPLYLTIGTVGSLFTLALLLLPRTPAGFAVAFMAENVVQALSFTSAVAICLSTIGKDNPLAATQFSLLTSATVLPILYMGVLDGRAYSGLAGVNGLNGMYLWDGCLSLAACVAMAFAMWRWPVAGGQDGVFGVIRSRWLG